jgi:simple sugar transport system permease protein
MASSSIHRPRLLAFTGGRYSLAGTVVGALLIATLVRTIPNIGIPSEANYLFKAFVVILVCLLQSPRARAFLGFRGRATTESKAVPA